jgi:hypothetical protein
MNTLARAARLPTARLPTVVTLVGLAGATVATWWLWLGSDTEYQVDSVTNTSSGPYEPWQVVGCVLCLGGLAVVGALLLRRPLLIVPTMTVAFVVPWSVVASTRDDSGLWGVGAILLTAGMAVGTLLVASAVAGLRRLRRR